MKSSKPKLVVNTPIRTRDATQQSQQASNRALLTPSKLNKENCSNVLQTDLYANKSSLSPNKVAASRKPTISSKALAHQYSTLPSQETSGIGLQLRQAKASQGLVGSSRLECVNHSEKEAEYRILIEGELMQYCAKCSANLASQGFPVERLDTKGARRSSLASISPAQPVVESKPTFNVDPSILCHPRYTQITSFLSMVSNLDQQLRRNGQTFDQLPTHYNEQLQLLDEFYEAMISYMKHVKSQHLNLIKAELRKYVQIGQIECGEIEDSLSELNSIVCDMQTNINSIVKEITEDKYRECFNFYSREVELYKHRAEEQANTLGEITQMSKEELSGKLQQFRNAVNEMFGIKEVSANQPGTFSNTLGACSSQNNYIQKQTTPISKKGAAMSQRQPNTGHGPFRNLFDQQGYGQAPEGLPDESPQFKNI